MPNKTIAIESAKIAFRNFSGKEGTFNPAGRRNFCVFLPEAIAEDLVKDGWNVRWLEPKDEGASPMPYLQVTVSYANQPPKIVVVTSTGKSVLDEQSVGMLDWADIADIDLILTPYMWTVSGRSGVKAYVKSMYITLVEDDFEKKYYGVPDSATNTVGGCGNCGECDGHCGHHEH